MKLLLYNDANRLNCAGWQENGSPAIREIFRLKYFFLIYKLLHKIISVGGAISSSSM